MPNIQFFDENLAEGFLLYIAALDQVIFSFDRPAQAFQRIHKKTAACWVSDIKIASKNDSQHPAGNAKMIAIC